MPTMKGKPCIAYPSLAIPLLFCWPFRLLFCLSFRSAAEESAFAFAYPFFPTPTTCHPERICLTLLSATQSKDLRLYL